MDGGRLARAAFAALTVGVVAASPVLASNEFAIGRKIAATAIYDGVRGNQEIRTDPATLTGVAYVHQVQISLGDDTPDFLAIGTYNGLGPGACTDSYDANWSVYTDGELGGMYFCNTEQANAYGVGSNPSFAIQYRVCQGITRWALAMGGTDWECRSTPLHSGDMASAGLETLDSPYDQNIDVKYTNVQTTVVNSSSWDNFGSCDKYVDTFYSYTCVSVSAFNVFLAPLN